MRKSYWGEERLEDCIFQKMVQIFTHSPPQAPPKNEIPPEIGRYFMGRISDGIASRRGRVARQIPMRIPPPINVFISVALAEMQAPMNEKI